MLNVIPDACLLVRFYDIISMVMFHFQMYTILYELLFVQLKWLYKILLGPNWWFLYCILITNCGIFVNQLKYGSKSFVYRTLYDDLV